MVARPVEVVVAFRDELGECPVWDDRTGVLHRVDAVAGAVIGLDVHTGAERRVELGRHVGSLALRHDGAGLLVAAQGGFGALDLDTGSHEVLAPVAPGDPSVLMNDGACDPAGRFLAGTMAFDERPGAGALYRLDLDGTVTTVLDDLTVSNGIGWSPDGGTVYLADSGPGVVHAFDYDLGSGAFGDGRVLLRFEGDDGVADGLTVDDEGCLWTALWGGGQVRRWSPDGELLAVVEVPGVAQTSSCAFAGPGRDLLVVSTSAQGLDDAARAAQPDAGRLFTARPGGTGPPATPYRGPLEGLRQEA